MSLNHAFGDGVVHGSDSSTVDLELVTAVSLLSFSCRVGEKGREGRRARNGLLEPSVQWNPIIGTLKCDQDTTIL